MAQKQKKKTAPPDGGGGGAAPAANKIVPPKVDDTIKAIDRAEKAAKQEEAEAQTGCGCW